MQRFSALAAGRPNIHLITHYVVMRENLHEVVPFLSFAKTLNPARVEFDPVRHVADWHVENGTGWTFDGERADVRGLPGGVQRGDAAGRRPMRGRGPHL